MCIFLINNDVGHFLVFMGYLFIFVKSLSKSSASLQNWIVCLLNSELGFFIYSRYKYFVRFVSRIQEFLEYTNIYEYIFLAVILHIHIFNYTFWWTEAFLCIRCIICWLFSSFMVMLSVSWETLASSCLKNVFYFPEFSFDIFKYLCLFL